MIDDINENLIIPVVETNNFWENLPQIFNWLQNFMSPVVAAFLGAGLASVLVSFWLEEKRRKRVEKEKAIEDLADLLAEWVKSSYVGNFTNEDRWRLQTKYWRSILRLDKEILDVLISRFANSKDAVPTNEIVVLIRQKLLKLKKPDIKHQNLNSWLPEKKAND